MAQKDITEKTLEAYNDVFADVINVFFFQGEPVIQEGDLEDAQPRSYYKADGKLREQERDVSKYWRRHKLRIALVGFENQTQEDKDMPLRVIGYDGAAYRNQIKSGSKERYPVTTVVLYFNPKKRWSQPLHLKECFEIPEELKPYVNDYKVHLVDVAWLSREQVSQFKSDFRIVADYFVQMRENGDYVPSKATIRHVHEVMRLMAVMTGDTRFEEVYQEGAEGKNMCEFLDRLEARGEARGLEQGMAQGMAQGIARGEIRGMIKACREFGMDAAKILAKIMSQYQLTEQEAGEYLQEICSA